MKTSSQRYWPAVPGAVFIGVLAGIVGILATLSGDAALRGSVPTHLPLGTLVGVGSVGFCVGSLAMLLAYRRDGTTVGSIGTAIKDLLKNL